MIRAVRNSAMRRRTTTGDVFMLPAIVSLVIFCDLKTSIKDKRCSASLSFVEILIFFRN
jgi:hypothetical protein